MNQSSIVLNALFDSNSGLGNFVLKVYPKVLHQHPKSAPHVCYSGSLSTELSGLDLYINNER